MRFRGERKPPQSPSSRCCARLSPSPLLLVGVEQRARVGVCQHRCGNRVTRKKSLHSAAAKEQDGGVRLPSPLPALRLCSGPSRRPAKPPCVF